MNKKIIKKTITFKGVKITVTNNGRLFHAAGPRKGQEYKYNYLSAFKYTAVTLYNKKEQKSILCYVHRAVAQAFLKRPSKKIKDVQINHIDNNPKNNHVSNLEWVSRKQNNSTKHKIRLQRKNHIHTNHEGQMIEAINTKTGALAYFENGIKAAKEIGVSHVLVYNVLNPKYPVYTAKGWSLAWVEKESV